MLLLERYLDIVARLAPAGTVGAGLMLGSTLSASAAERPRASDASVSARLAAIRAAVFVLTGPRQFSELPDPDLHFTWGNRWNNGRFGRHRWGWGGPAWNNWRNGGRSRGANFWRNR
jgi:hypothetical protein